MAVSNELGMTAEGRNIWQEAEGEYVYRSALLMIDRTS